MRADNHPTSARNARPRAAADRDREMQEWARSLGIAPVRLRQAVAVVGITPRRIREYLRKNP